MAKKNTLSYKDMKIEDIINWCKENNQVAWLKETAAKQVPVKVYPRKTVIDENGKKKSIADKSKKPKIEKRKITFIQIKTEFVDKFMPEIKPKKKAAEPTMYDLIDAL